MTVSWGGEPIRTRFFARRVFPCCGPMFNEVQLGHLGLRAEFVAAEQRIHLFLDWLLPKFLNISFLKARVDGPIRTHWCAHPYRPASLAGLMPALCCSVAASGGRRWLRLALMRSR